MIIDEDEGSRIMVVADDGEDGVLCRVQITLAPRVFMGCG